MILEILKQEFERGDGLPYVIVLLRVAGAAVLSGLIGLEREVYKNTAGLRTHMLISVAAALFALMTLELMHSDYSDNDAVRLDPLRLVEAVTAGVAFLAAGMVVYAKGNVKGLTTGAGMWLASGIGLACGLGYWSIALTGSVAGILLMVVLRRIEYAVGLKE